MYQNLRRTPQGVIINTDSEGLQKRRREIEQNALTNTLLRRIEELEKRVQELENVKA